MKFHCNLISRSSVLQSFLSNDAALKKSTKYGFTLTYKQQIFFEGHAAGNSGNRVVNQERVPDLMECSLAGAQKGKQVITQMGF